MLLYQEDASAQESVVVMAAVHDHGFELINHPPYPTDLGANATTDLCAGAFSS